MKGNTRTRTDTENIPTTTPSGPPFSASTLSQRLTAAYRRLNVQDLDPRCCVGSFKLQPH
jgi:hypothetical protein